MTNSLTTYQSALDNLKPADRQKAYDDIQKRVEVGGVDSATWFELRSLFLAMPKKETDR